MKLEHAKRAAAILTHAWQDGLPLESLPEECRPRTLAEAYRIQDLLTAAIRAAGRPARRG